MLNDKVGTDFYVLTQSTDFYVSSLQIWATR